jgi:hypothetical protein
MPNTRGLPSVVALSGFGIRYIVGTGFTELEDGQSLVRSPTPVESVTNTPKAQKVIK